ncbi:MAG TPA: M3 family oligoendopeptidase [Thermomicrobiales bacterium]|jgi:pepF/M3 family oligoendopeptidase|nr:M3 family oligoendopeptidase [Thermomicrobiales bacterium]
MTATTPKPAVVSEDGLPRWDLDVLYPGVDSPELAAAIELFAERVAALTAELDALEADPGAPAGPAFDRIVTNLNDTLEVYRPVRAYLYGKVSVDSRDDAAQAQASALEVRAIALTQVRPRMQAWIAAHTDGQLAEGSALFGEYPDIVRQARRAAAHLLPAPEEELLATLNPSGASAWGRLRQDTASQIMITLEGDGPHGGRSISITEARNLAHDSDRDVRRRAYEAEIAGWERHAVPIAAAMNGIKGQVNTISKRRGYETALDQGLENNRLDRETLDALVGATEDAFPMFRRYMQAKARLLGLERLAWYDILAPVGDHAASGADRWAWPNSVAFVERHFRAFDPALGDLAKRSDDERWVDAGSRPGKDGGAYCMPFQRDSSRILHNFTASYDGMSTLAHELGHAWHNYVQRDEPYARRGAPMVVAETASTFCETIIRRAALAEASADDQLVILESFLTGMNQISVDILSRFRFEQAVFEKRRERQLSVAELCDLMTDAQRATYGDGLDRTTLHPYAWAAKPHYYSEASFYNYPYLFGGLFGIGLYSAYLADPDGFHARYAELLRRTGQADPVELAAEFGVDIRSREFWESSLEIVREDIDQFVALVDAAMA